MAEEWGWYNKENAEDVVIPPIAATAVYSNSNGDIVIRQQDTIGDEDSFIFIPKQYVAQIIQAMAKEANLEIAIP